jgi:DNA-binding GntR family transcriptional regulator
MHYKSKVDIIYERVLDDIINGVYKQGDRIVISKLAKDNKVSDIPVREAMRRIESEGLVKIIANHGAIVAKYEPDDIAQFYIINAVVGAYATRLSADYLTESDYLELERINGEIKQAVETDDTEKYLLYDESFHLKIYSSIPYPIIYKSINNTLLRRIDKQILPSKEWQLESVEMHKELLRLSKEKSYSQLEILARSHMLSAAENIIKKMKEK